MTLAPVGVAMGRWSPNDDTQRRADIRAIKDVGFTRIRSDINWSGSERKPGEFTTQQATVIGTAMRDLGMQWNVILAYTPPFYSTAPASVTAPYDQDKYPPKPEYYDEWERWVEAIVRAIYETGCSFTVEIWNEENHTEFFGHPDPAVYVQLLKRARAAIRRVNTKILIVFGGMAPAPDRYDAATGLKSGQSIEYRASTFVEKCYEAGLSKGDYSAMNFHPYNGTSTLAQTAGKPWDMSTTVRNELLAVMKAHGEPNKLIWSTEFGYGTSKVSEATQAKLLVDQIKFLRSQPNAGPVFVFNWKAIDKDPKIGFNSYGLLRFDGTRKPAVAAIKAYLKTAPSEAA